MHTEYIYVLLRIPSACFLSFLHLSVYEPGLMHPKKNPNGRFPPNYPKSDNEAEKAKIETEKAKIDKVRVL